MTNCKTTEPQADEKPTQSRREYIIQKVIEHSIECGMVDIQANGPLSDVDLENMLTTLTGCSRHYEKSPCLKVFRVISPLNYYAGCGERDVQ
jgi:hypothetical protein